MMNQMMNAIELSVIDSLDLDLVTGGKKATYLNVMARGAVDGAITGASGGAGMLPFAALSGPITPLTAGVMVGGSAAVGSVIGAASGAWELHKARHPLEP